MDDIQVARTDAEIASCFSVMQQLRTHLEEEDFVRTVRRQYGGGYQLAFLRAGTEVQAVAGYRIIDNLANGRVLYVDDLSTNVDARSRGFGTRLFHWLSERAREEGCSTIELDSGVQRFDAHRFYLVNRMSICSFHFRLALQAGPPRVK